MDLWELKPGDRIRTRDSAVAEVLSETEDGAWIKVRYVKIEDDPALIGTEDLVSGHDVAELFRTIM